MSTDEKKFQTYLYLIYVFFFVMMIGLAMAVYFYFQLKKSKEQVNTLEMALQKAEEKLATLPKKDSAQIADLQNTIKQLKTLQNASPEKIVDELKDQETHKRVVLEQQQYEKRRTELIDQLFLAGKSSESIRKEAANAILRDYRQDGTLVTALLERAEKQIDAQTPNPTWQTIYLLREISRNNADLLKPHADTLKGFFSKVREAGLARPGGSTEKDIKEILNKIG